MELFGNIITGVLLILSLKWREAKSAPKPEASDQQDDEIDIWKHIPETIFRDVELLNDEYPGQFTIRIKREAPENLPPLPITSHQTDSSQESAQVSSQSDTSHQVSSQTGYHDYTGADTHAHESRGTNYRTEYHAESQETHGPYATNRNNSVMYDAIRRQAWPNSGSHTGSGYETSGRYYATSGSGTGVQQNIGRSSGTYADRRPVPYSTSGSVIYNTGGSVPYSTGGSVPYATSGTGYYSTTGQTATGTQRPYFPFQRSSVLSSRSEYVPSQSHGQAAVYVPNGAAVSSDPNCPTSDFRLIVNGMECQQAIDTLGSFICYNYERASRACCEKCLSLKEPSNVGCEYGDKSYQCKNIEPFDCYVQRNRDICCQTCERFRTQQIGGVQGCEFGDLTPRCQTVLHRPHLCYMPENQRLCCVTCPRLGSGDNPNCQWGDQNPDLCQPFDSRGALRINCYQNSVQQVCCNTCERLGNRLRHAPAGCEYGDRPVTFSTPSGVLDCGDYIRQYGINHCDSPDVSQYCCYTCWRYRRGSQ